MCKNSVCINSAIVPLQKIFVNNFKADDFNIKPGNGGFLFSCHLGAYWAVDGFPGQTYWQMININGLTMQQAVTKYWNSDLSSTDN